MQVREAAEGGERGGVGGCDGEGRRPPRQATARAGRRRSARAEQGHGGGEGAGGLRQRLEALGSISKHCKRAFLIKLG